jgi:hypothetical protein
VADVGGTDLALTGHGIALEWIQMKGHHPECRVPS